VPRRLRVARVGDEVEAVGDLARLGVGVAVARRLVRVRFRVRVRVRVRVSLESVSPSRAALGAPDSG